MRHGWGGGIHRQASRGRSRLRSTVGALGRGLVGAVAQNWTLLVENFGRLSLITILFCLISLTVGYLAPRLIKVGKRQSIASSFEIGIHNATLAIVIAQTVIGSVEMSLPAAVYGVLMFFVALGFGFLIRRRGPAAERADASADAVAAETSGAGEPVS